MSIVEAKARGLSGAAQAASAAKLGRPTAGLRCLVASGDVERQQWLAHSASQWGWETIVCNQAVDAERCADRLCVQLAFVDLEGPAGAEFRSLVRQLGDERTVLLVVCGNPGNAHEEVWVRQVGVWFYLPGVRRDTASLGLLSRDARTIVEHNENRKSGHTSGKSAGQSAGRTGKAS